MSTTLCLVEDDSCTRATLIDVLRSRPGFHVAGAYGTTADAIVGIPRDRPDVALVDINLPDSSGIECVRQIKKQMPQLRILMLTTYDESDLIFESLRAGADGYLLKKAIMRELFTAIEEVQSGGAPMSMSIARKVVDHFQGAKEKRASDVEQLSPRENEILALLAQGLMYKEIADRIGISFNTTRSHMQHIYEKLHVQSRAEAMLKYLGRK